MKLMMSFLVSSLVVLSASAQGFGFKADSPVPAVLQKEIVETILDWCPEVFSSFEEVQTQVRIEDVDQGVQDQFFTTELRGLVEITEPSYHKITVQSAKYAIDNPSVKNTEIIDIDLPIEVCE